MQSSFFSDLLEALRRSLADTFGVLVGDDIDWVELLATGLSKAAVSVILITLFLIVYLVFRAALEVVLKRFKISPDVSSPLVIGLRYVMFLATAIAVLALLGVGQEILVGVGRAAMVALLFFVAWMAITKVMIGLLRRYGLDPSIEQLLRNVVSLLIMAFGVVTVLAQFGFDILSMIAGLGIVGLAVGFAAQSTLANFIAGITILLERPFGIGDWVRINDQEGQVTEIALRTTRLRTRDNVYTLIPNDSVASADIVNLSAGGPLRVRIPIGIAYKESAKAARELILPIVREHEYVLITPELQPGVPMTEWADSSINMVILYWIRPEHIDIQPRISFQILEAAKIALDEAGIEIPFPHLQLFIDDAKGLKPIVEPFQALARPANDTDRKEDQNQDNH